MEFQNPLEEYSDEDVDVALSFCGLVTERGVQEIALGDSNTGSIDHEGFGFDFDFGMCGMTTDHAFPADDLFRRGRLLPPAPQRCGTESVQSSSFEKPISEYVLTWRNDSLSSDSSLWSTSSSNSSSSRRKINSGEISRLSKSKSKGKPKPLASGGKISGIWRVLTLGLIKPPPMKLEDMPLRQSKANNNINGAKNLDLRRSASCIYYKDRKLEKMEAKAVNFEEKCSSVKEHVVVKKTPWLKSWKTLARLPSFNRSRASSNAVVENGRLQKA